MGIFSRDFVGVEWVGGGGGGKRREIGGKGEARRKGKRIVVAVVIILLQFTLSKQPYHLVQSYHSLHSNSLCSWSLSPPSDKNA